MKTIDELKEQLEAIESASWSQLSPDMPKPAPSFLRGIMELLEYHDNVIRGMQNVERQKWEAGRLQLLNNPPRNPGDGQP